MNNKYTISIFSIILVTLISGCSSTAEKPSEATVSEVSTQLGARYPTHERLDYMYKCIQQHGKQVSATEPCGCKIDKIEQKLSFSDYEKAKTYTNLSRQAGDNGAAFRDPAQSAELRQKLKSAEAAAEKSCFGSK